MPGDRDGDQIMANTYVRDTAGNYPVKHNKRELKVIETTLSSIASNGVSELAAAAADYAVTDTDGYISFIVNDAISITMPTAATNAGRKIQFVQLGTAVLTLVQNADDANINGADANYVGMDAAGDRAEFISTGAEWLLVSSTIA